MIIGKLRLDADTYTGHVHVMGFATSLFVKVPPGSTPASGGFTITNEHHTEVGIAWLQEGAGLQLKLDSPALPQPAYCWLISAGNDLYDLAWVRPPLHRHPIREGRRNAANAVISSRS